MKEVLEEMQEPVEKLLAVLVRMEITVATVAK